MSRARVAVLTVWAITALGDSPQVLRVEVQGLRSDSGTLRCALYPSAAGFPSDAAKALKIGSAAITHRSGTCLFRGLPAGVYAVAAVHDENNNGKMDTGLFGIPTEGYAVSNDAKGSFGPPTFKDARFRYDGGLKVLRLHIAD